MGESAFDEGSVRMYICMYMYAYARSSVFSPSMLHTCFEISSSMPTATRLQINRVSWPVERPLDPSLLDHLASIRPCPLARFRGAPFTHKYTADNLYDRQRQYSRLYNVCAAPICGCHGGEFAWIVLGVLRKKYNKLLPRRMGEAISVRSSRRFFHRVVPGQTRVRRFAVALHLGKRRLECAPPTITLWYLNVNSFRIFCTRR